MSFYPTSNVRVFTPTRTRTLTLEDFNDCGECADGNHTAEGWDQCKCCQMPSHFHAGMEVLL